MTDIEIAQAHEMKPITEIAAAAGIDEQHLELYGKYKAKLDLTEIRKLGLKAGLALNPGTDLSAARWLAPDLDLLLLMSVNPGFSGQAFIPQTYEKIRAARALLAEAGAAGALIQVDGGACPENAGQLLEAGADVLVSGSAFFGHKP